MNLLRQRPAPSPALEATIANPNPAALTVAIDAFDGERAHVRHEWEVVWWAPLPDAVPRRGDRCLAVLSDSGRMWVIAGAWTGTP